MKTLCVDLGNTRMKAALFIEDQLAESFVLEDDGFESIKEIIERCMPDKSILSSVIHHNINIEGTLNEYTQFHKLSHLTKLNFTVPVGKPETMGADRLALAAAAVHQFPGKNNLVIGLGSCITHDYTALLPIVEKDWNFPLVGYDTKTNILSGVLLGMAKEIEGIIGAYAEKYGNFNALLTGGDCTYFARLLKNKIFADPDLLFKGLYAISETNN